MTDKFAKVMAATTAVGWGVSRAGTVVDWVKRKTTARVVVYGEHLEAVFDKVGFNGLGPFVEYGAFGSGGADVPVAANDRPGPVRKSPGPGHCVLKLEGRRVSFNYVVEERKYGSESRYIVLMAHVKHFYWLMEWVESCYQAYRDSRSGLLQMQAMNSGGYWDFAGSRPRRPIDTVEHPDLAPQVICRLIEEWQETEQSVISKGENFHIGFLLHGRPGTGKTSTAIAVASHLKRDIYVAAPSDIKTFQPQNWRSVSGGVLLIEECDEVFPIRGNGGDDKATSSLLSAFDGPFSPWNVVRIYTTNHIDRLDPSFRRKGRVDHEFEFPDRIHVSDIVETRV